MAQTICFETIEPSFCNALPSSLRLTMLSGSRSVSLSLLKTYFYSWGLCTGSATEWSLSERRFMNLEISYNTIGEGVNDLAYFSLSQHLLWTLSMGDAYV